ncbi:MAG: uroporphyrinogen-III C-methyltransferase [Lachnospiraceae bacterium]|nr:uroporphyrinogen-III C-methyltransferase [Lachnospiraceae bacterium]
MTQISKTAASYVSLVGAGCGHDLITLRGLAAVRDADLILYDNLIDEALLKERKPGCVCIYTGKRAGLHSMPQNEITALLIDKAQRGGHIVRLKGGDSFVFGRGGEEVLALQEAGIPYEVIPGITSSVAVPEELGIPVTHRKTARSFTVVTGHTMDGTGEDREALARLSGTLVFLMGLRAVEEISADLIRFGKDPETPAAILCGGFTRGQLRLDGTLSTISERLPEAFTPAIFVVGETAGMHLEKTFIRPLSGATVLVTGTEHFANKLTARLRSLGAEVDNDPCLAITPIPASVPSDFSSVNWLVFTSANGVDLFFRALREQHVDARALAHLHFAVIGTGTEKALEERGIFADFIPTEFTAQVLGRELPAHLKDTDQVWLLRASNGSPDLPEELERAGVSYRDIAIYDTTPLFSDSESSYPAPAADRSSTAETSNDAVRDMAETKADGSSIAIRTFLPLSAPDYACFSSGADVRAFFAQSTLPQSTIGVCIGPTTLKTFRENCSGPAIMAEKHTAEGICEAILKNYACKTQDRGL